MIPARYRKALYAALAALAPVVVFYGLMSEHEVALWLGVVQAVSNGLALANVER